MNAAADDAQSIFVRNLPFSATTEDLEELCGGIGPVKRASIIQSAEGVSRGFGFVKFAIPEDATRAAAILNGTNLKGRNLAVEVAVKRGQKPAHAPQTSLKKPSPSPAKKQPQEGEQQEGEDGEGEGTQKQPKAPRPTTGKDEPKRGKGAAAGQQKKAGSHHALLSSQPSKTLIAFNLAAQTTEKQLYKRIKKIETPISIKTEDMDGSSRVAILVFETPAAAKKVQKKLDQHIIHGQKLSLRPFHPAQQGGKGALDGEATTEAGKGVGCGAVSADLSQMHGQAKRNNRLIVRNLSFKATEADLKQALSAFGPVLEATIPKVNVRGVEGRRGFGFVTFACAPDAEKAVKHEGALKVCGREVAVDMCMGKREYQEEKQKKEKEEQQMKKGAAQEEDKEVEEEVEEETSLVQDDDEAEDGESASSSEDGEEEDGGEEEEAVEDEDEEDEDEEDEDEEDEDEESKRSTKPSDIKEGKTIFVRNIPFDATPESLKLAFHDYAPAAFAIIVKDRITGMSKGTAFIKFKTVEGMETVLGAASAAGGSLTLLGRDLKIDRAIEREDAPVPKVSGATDGAEGGAGSKSKADRRNLYLANEGLVIDSEAQDEIPKVDLEKRKREQAEKKTKLRNPFFFVSPTRLSIRNLGTGVMDNDLRALLLKAVQKGLEEEKVTSEDLKMHLKAQGLYDKAADPKCLVIPTPRPRDVHIKVKVLRDLDKKPQEGIYPSRGYGFADFSSHVHALAALRHLNNNPAFSSYAIKAGAGKRSRLIVSFAVENHKALQKKVLRGEKVRTAAAPEALKGTKKTPPGGGLKRKLAGADGLAGGEHEEESSGAVNEAEDPAEKRKSRGQRQRERKRQRKEAGEEEGEEGVAPSRRSTRHDATGKGKLHKAAAALQQKRGEKKGSAVDSAQQQKKGRGHQQRGEEPDDELTRLAAAAAAAHGGDQTGKKGGRRKSTAVQEIKEDKQFAQTVSAYKQKLLGGGAGAGGEEAKGGSKKRERWFD